MFSTWNRCSWLRLTKRIIDIFGALLLLCVTMPIMIIVAIGVWIDLSGPVFFRQKRAGLRGKEFRLTKFRTMHDARNQDGDLLADQERLTPFGRWLRRSSLDELPELWNVLVGEMSLVGPRPLLVEYNNLYNKSQIRRLLMPPGLTGWAAVNGRNSISWEEKFALDVWYIDNWSIWLDIRILCLTFSKVLSGEGVESGSDCTMEAFSRKERNGLLDD